MLPEKTACRCSFRKQNPANFNVLPGQWCESVQVGQK
jgi:hypothetical protein